jgi:hypothetical protein
LKAGYESVIYTSGIFEKEECPEEVVVLKARSGIRSSKITFRPEPVAVQAQQNPTPVTACDDETLAHHRDCHAPTPYS